MVTSGGWAYCEQVRALARRTGYTLLCGRYANDGYTGPGLRAERHLDWGNPAYLDSLARKVRAAHRRVGGELVLIGVSYSGFGVATLASHHPELQPDRLIAIDTYLELVPRRAALPALTRPPATSTPRPRARGVSSWLVASRGGACPPREDGYVDGRDLVDRAGRAARVQRRNL